MNGNQIVYRTIAIRGTSEGLDKLQADLLKVAAGHKDVTVAAEETNRSTLSLEQAWKRSVLRLDEVARAQNNMAKETKLANEALKQGVASPEAHARQLEVIKQRYGDVGKASTTATDQVAKGAGLARHELINLGRQAQDVGVSLVSGQSPLMVLAQQGSQIADVFISSGKSISEFFNQAIGWAGRFITSFTGIVTVVGAIAAGAIYMASQFLKSSTTVEEAIAKQKQLLKETKTAVDDLIDAQIRLQSMDLKRFETKRNEEDLNRKLIDSLNEMVRLAERQATIPTGGGMPEMGIAPTGTAPQGTRIREVGEAAAVAAPGIKEMNEAIERLNARIAANQPGMVEFINELGRIGEASRQANPALATTIEGMIALAQESLKTEQSLLKARAALQSVAQVELANLLMQQGAEAAQRMAEATLEIAAAYPGMSVEVAKQLNDLQGQLNIAEARTGVEKMAAQEIVTQNQLLAQGRTLEEAIAIAARQRLLIQTEINAEADRTLKNLQNEYELIKATSAEERGRIAARQEYQKLVDQGVDPSKASAIASQMTANARATEEMARGTRQVANNIGDANDETKSWSVQMDEANDAINRVTNSTERFNGQIYIALSQWGSVADEIGKTLDLLQGSQFNPQGYTSTYDPLNVAGSKRSAEQMYGGNTEEVRNILGHVIGYRQKIDTTPGALTKSIMDKLIKNTDATEKNTAATQSMTDVLSPFYSSDPRRTHLGFRSFAGGGIMTPYGELPLKQYQGGGVATSPQVAVYGEGSTPEAYVPVPAGRIPVEIKQPANSNARPINVTINVAGNADANTVAALKSTAFQQAQSMRRALG